MKVTVQKVDIAEKHILRNLLELYRYDFSEFYHDDVNEEGLYGYQYLDLYWTEAERHPFIIRVDGKLAGFALIREIANQEWTYYWMTEFFVLRKYRRKGVGKIAAFTIFNMFPGKWQIGQIEQNIPAQKFWRKVISEYTNGNFKEEQRKGWNGPIQKFQS